MHDEVIGAQRDSAYDFIVICLNRADAHDRIGCRQIDQVIGVDDQRPEAEFGALGPKFGGVDFRNARAHARPHARAGGENLQRVAAEFRGALKRAGEAAGNRSMNADANAAVAPSGSLRLGYGFGAVFVAAIEKQDRSVGGRHFSVAGLHSIESLRCPQIPPCGRIEITLNNIVPFQSLWQFFSSKL